jgi:transposase
MPCGEFQQQKAAEHIPEALIPALGPILEQIGALTQRIRDYDRQLETISKERYPETELLRQVEGVGPLTALTFVLTLEDPYRFERPAAWAPILGWWQPKISQETETLRGASPRKVMRCLA